MSLILNSPYEFWQLQFSANISTDVTGAYTYFRRETGEEYWFDVLGNSGTGNYTTPWTAPIVNPPPPGNQFTGSSPLATNNANFRAMLKSLHVSNRNTGTQQTVTLQRVVNYPDGTTPATINETAGFTLAAGETLIYEDGQGWYILTSTGLVKTASSISAVFSATDGSTVTFSLANGLKQRVVLGGNRTLALSGDTDGVVFSISLKQDGTGSRTVTWWSNILWPGGATPVLTTTASKSDDFVFLRYSSTEYHGFISGQNI